MNQPQQLASRLREIILNGTWVANTNYRNELTALSVSTATTKIGTLNTIADLAQHIHYYTAGVLNVFRGGTLDIKDQYSFDFPPVTTQEQWDGILNTFFADSEELAKCIEQLPGNSLDGVFVDEKYSTYRRNIDGMIEHSYYHLGQIVLLKKLVEARFEN